MPTLCCQRSPLRIALVLLLALNAHSVPAQISAGTVPLLLPSAIAYDAQGNLYIAEAANHDVRKVNNAGTLTTIAGTGTQGFDGDNGPAIDAELDSPQGLALDPNENLYIADTHNNRIRKITAATGVITTIAGDGIAGYSGDNGLATAARLDHPTAIAIDSAGDLYIADTGNHRIRKVTAATGIITTIAGDGTEGFAGDNGPATLASIDSPSGLAIDSSGNLYLADTHNQRIRRISGTGIITTVAGTGVEGYSGDNAAAIGAKMSLPHGLTLDSAGNVYVADTRNHRIREINAVTGQITTIAGDGTQTFAGDNNPATAASLDTPRAATTSPNGLVTLADTANQRIRQLDSSNPAIIHTIAGLGNVVLGALTVTAPAVATYGSGHVTISLSASSMATGNIAFSDTSNGVTTAIGTVPLSQNTATLNTAALPAGIHQITATYAGDATHGPQSAGFTLTIAKAAAVLTVSTSVPTISVGQPLTITATVASSAGTPTGTITLFDNATALDRIQIAPSGEIAFTTTALGAGSHTITAVYSGDNNFTSASASPATISIGGPPIGDFALAASGATTQTVVAGNSANYTFAVQWQGTPLSSPIVLSASGLPSMAKASFNPAYLPPGSASNTFTLTVSTAGSAASSRIVSTVVFALLLLPIAGLGFRRRHNLTTIFAVALLTTGLVLSTGCGARVYPGALDSPSATPYTITVAGTATTPAGTTVQHTATVTLILKGTG